MACKPKKISRAFTLVELLLVIGIIGVLVSILLPVLARVRTLARATVCSSNVRQMVIAYTMYANEHRGWMMANSEAPATGGVTWWFGWTSKTTGTNRDLNVSQGLIATYLGGNISANLLCPDFPYDGAYTPKFVSHAAGYGLNRYLSPLQIEQRQVRMASVRHASKTAVFVDGLQQDFSTTAFNEPFYLGIDSGDPNYGGFVHFRHKGNANTAFLDGHVEPIASSNCVVIHKFVGGSPAGNFTTGATDSNTLYGDPRF